MNINLETPGYLTKNDYFIEFLSGLKGKYLPEACYVNSHFGPDSFTKGCCYLKTLEGNLMIQGYMDVSGSIAANATLIDLSPLNFSGRSSYFPVTVYNSSFSAPTHTQSSFVFYDGSTQLIKNGSLSLSNLSNLWNFYLIILPNSLT